MAEGETGSLLGIGAGKLSDLVQNIPAVNVVFYSLDYINTSIWNLEDDQYKLNEKKGNKNEDSNKASSA